MRRRLLASTLTIVVAILVLFGVPLGVVLDRSVHADAKSRLQAEATRIARELGRQPLSDRTITPALLERLVPSGDRALVIHTNGVVTVQLGAGMTAAGWLDANNRRGRIKAGDADIEVAGVHDSHIDRDRYDAIAGAADPSADLRLGVLHSPEPAVLDRFAADGFDLLLAGHTHGGQVCLPWFGTLVTNCGIDRSRARGLHRHPAVAAAGDGPERPWLHVSAGLGTSPWAPVRFSCRPEATLLTLVPRIS